MIDDEFEHETALHCGADAAAPAALAAAPLKRDLVAGLEKGLAVIEAFDQERPRLTISEVAERTGLTRAAARRYLLTLTHLGFVHQERKMFALAPRVLRLSQSYMHSARLPRVVQPALAELANTLKEASAASVLDDADLICIAATTAGRNVSATLQPGIRVPAYCTANGRVLVAALSPAQAEAWLARQSLRALTPTTITKPERLRAELQRTREQGYATCDQEMEVGMRTLSVPLSNWRGETVAAMNLTVHASRMSIDDLVASGLPALRQAQMRLKQLL
jgi:IclR family transcriptional regulator, pca regulon regulatory protein